MSTSPSSAKEGKGNMKENTNPSPRQFTANIQVVGSFFLFFNSWGFANAYGVFQTYYETDLLRHESPSNISWIGSVQAFLLLLVGGLLTGPLFDAGYVQHLVAFGSFMVVFGMMMTSLCQTYWQVFLAQGITVGIGVGCLLIPSLAIVPQYFDKHRAFAMGVAISGSSIGGVLYPIIFLRLQPKIGFPWTVRILAFVALVTLSMPLVGMKPKKLPPTPRKLFDWPAFKDKPYTFFTIGEFFGFAGIYIPFYYVTSYAQQRGIIEGQLALYLLVIMNAASTFGRVIPNFLADKTGPLNVAAPFTAVCALLGFCWVAIESTAGLVVFAVLYGFFTGTFISLCGPCIASLSPNLSALGTHMGMSFGLSGFGLFLGSPVAGALLSQYGFTAVQVWCGATNIAAAVFILAARLAASGPKLIFKA
ncbi:hypothetical protein MMC28_000094 [Mycoblastus sanguinarius]|nr:hypothetical protein [Mycoblastus sanguinarius]